nr:hypothetical protein [Tanacetum cinerariifolium]
MLTAFFELNQTDTEARQHLYKDILKFYTWNKSTHKWNRQKQGKMIGRMVSANPVEGERFYLRILLQRVKGPTGFDYLYTINDVLYTTFPGEEKVYYSFDEAEDDTHNYYPLEFLNSLNVSGLPPHHLRLKIGCPIIFLRNLDPANRLCNGTRLICKRFDPNVINAEIAVGQHTGVRVLLPRIPLAPFEEDVNLDPPNRLCNGTRLICKRFNPNVINAEIAIGQHTGVRVLLPRIPLAPFEEDVFHFKLKRTQFPVRLSFAMTINKAQGQTIPNVGVYLPESVFSHG